MVIVNCGCKRVMLWMIMVSAYAIMVVKVKVVVAAFAIVVAKSKDCGGCYRERSKMLWLLLPLW